MSEFWINFFSNGCIVITIIMFATGIPQCMQMIKHKTTKNIPFLPYLMTNINTIGWIIYGKMTVNFTVVLINAIGAALQTLYMTVFLFFAADKTTPLIQSTFCGLTAAITWYMVTQYVKLANLAINIIGFICCTLTICMFASPLAEINTVIASKSTSSISFPLTVTASLCSAMWTLFGVALHDNFIVVPNALGFIASASRFYLFYKYPSDPLLPYSV
uniref:Sugar transporter SWEET1 n=1 Tax=Ciona savignyi TaxID=51511 RepID=H2ZBS3_CIOSA